MCNSAAHNSRPGRESLSKRLGRVARQIKARDGYACAYCGRTERAENAAGRHMHLDHLTPRADVGADVASNLVLACGRCNDERQALSLRAWAEKALATRRLVFTATSVRAQARRALPVV